MTTPPLENPTFWDALDLAGYGHIRHDFNALQTAFEVRHVRREGNSVIVIALVGNSWTRIPLL
jgi:hypothetical protein